MEEKLFDFFLFLRKNYLKSIINDLLFQSAKASTNSTGNFQTYKDFLERFFSKDEKAMVRNTRLKKFGKVKADLLFSRVKRSLVKYIPIYSKDIYVAAVVWQQLDDYIELLQEKFKSESIPQENTLQEVQQVMEEDLDPVFGNIVGGIARVDKANCFAKVNNAFASMHGFAPQEMTGKNYLEFICPDDKEKINSLFTDSAGPDKVSTEVRAVHKNGSFQYHEVIIIPIFDSHKTYAGHYDFRKDISKGKIIEEQLQSKETQFLSAQKIANMGTWELDCVNWIMHCSNEIREIYGIASKEIKYDDFLSYIHTEDRDTFKEKIELAFKKKQTLNIYHLILRPDGTEKTLHTVGEAWASSLEGKCMIMGVVHDITDKIIQENKFQVLLESAPDAIIAFDKNLLIGEWNKKAEEIFGWSRFEAIGKKVNMLVLPEKYRAETEKRVTNYLNTGRLEELAKETEMVALKKHGQLFPIEVTVSVMKQEKGASFVAFVRDISIRKATDDLLKKRAEELLKTNSELERFVYVASHDLQEPLRSISSYVQLLQMKYQNSLDKTANEYIKYAVEGSNRMHRLINDLLVYSQTASKEEVFTNTDCASILKMTMENMQLALKETNAEITFNPPLDKMPIIVAEETQIQELFQNLLSNALKFRNNSVTPRILISAVSYNSEDPKDNEFMRNQTEESRFRAENLPVKGWYFCVKDNGIGISKEYAEKIFVIFQRLHGRDKYPGTGIGLAICKKIVERHGGKIWVSSCPEGGSAFKFVIPKIKTS